MPVPMHVRFIVHDSPTDAVLAEHDDPAWDESQDHVPRQYEIDGQQWVKTSVAYNVAKSEVDIIVRRSR